MRIAVMDSGDDGRRRRLMKKVMSDFDCRGMIAKADTGRAHHPHVFAEFGLKGRQKLLCSKHRACQAVANADGKLRNFSFALLHDIEVGVKGCRFENFRQRQSHLFSQRCEVRAGDLAKGILNAVEILNEKVPATGAI
jgi:hypothetical protein